METVTELEPAIDAPAPETPLGKHFTWRDALYLPRWYRMASRHDGYYERVRKALEALFAKMDQVRDLLDLPIVIHCAWRPASYNKLVGGAASSAHLCGEDGAAACDFHVAGMTSDDVKKTLEPKLEELGLRMEDNGQHSAWIHLDTREPAPGHKRFFKP